MVADIFIDLGQIPLRKNRYGIFAIFGPGPEFIHSFSPDVTFNYIYEKALKVLQAAADQGLFILSFRSGIQNLKPGIRRIF
jgi:hypothetical protein